MPNVNFTCTKPNCNWQTGEVDSNVIGPLVGHHLAEAHPIETVKLVKLPKLPLPKQTRHFAAFGAAIEVWDHFAAFAAFREAKENKSYIDSKL